MNEHSHTQLKSKRPLIIMLLVAIFPVAAAYFAYFTGIGVPGTTVNAGTFIEPAISIENLIQREQWQRIQADKKWRLLIPIASPCDGPCEENLYTSRQVHIRLDQKSQRLERLAVPIDEIENADIARIKAEHPKLVYLDIPANIVSNWLNRMPQALGDDFYLLVDQEGNAMMRYTSEIHGNDVLKDIKRALKFSIDYQ